MNHLADSVLRIAQDIAPEFGFYEVDVEEPEPRFPHWLLTIVDKYEDEVEVELEDADAPEHVIREAITKAIEGRSAAAASVAAERDAERRAMYCD